MPYSVLFVKGMHFSSKNPHLINFGGTLAFLKIFISKYKFFILKNQQKFKPEICKKSRPGLHIVLSKYSGFYHKLELLSLVGLSSLDLISYNFL